MSTRIQTVAADLEPGDLIAFEADDSIGLVYHIEPDWDLTSGLVHIYVLIHCECGECGDPVFEDSISLHATARVGVNRV